MGTYRQRRARALWLWILTLALASALPLPLAQAQPQAWPARQVRMVSPYPAGVPPDIVARLVADKLTGLWGQAVFVDNRPGAGGIAGMSGFVRSPADGYTLALVAASTITVTPHLFKDPQFNPDRDLSVAAFVGTGPMMVAVSPGLPASSLPELIKLTKSRPGKINFAATLLNSVPHLTGLMLDRAAGMEMYTVPYNGSVPAMTATVGGEAQVIIDGLTTLAQYVKAGKLRAIAVTSEQRLPGYEQIPTVAETLPGFESVGWFAVFAPSGTPAAIVQKINTDVNRVMQMPDIAARMMELGVYPRPGTVNATDTFVQADRARWKKVLQATGVQPQ